MTKAELAKEVSAALEKDNFGSAEEIVDFLNTLMVRFYEEELERSIARIKRKYQMPSGF